MLQNSFKVALRSSGLERIDRFGCVWPSVSLLLFLTHLWKLGHFEFLFLLESVWVNLYFPTKLSILTRFSNLPAQSCRKGALFPLLLRQWLLPCYTLFGIFVTSFPWYGYLAVCLFFFQIILRKWLHCLFYVYAFMSNSALSLWIDKRPLLLTIVQMSIPKAIISWGWQQCPAKP